MIFFSFGSMIICSQITRRRKKKEKKRKKRKWSCTYIKTSMTISLILLKRSWRDDSNNTKKKSHMINEVSHTNTVKVLGLTCLWAARMTNSNHYWWPFIISLDLSHQNLFNNTDGIIIKISIFRYAYKIFFFISFVFFSLSSLQSLN